MSLLPSYPLTSLSSMFSFIYFPGFSKSVWLGSVSSATSVQVSVTQTWWRRWWWWGSPVRADNMSPLLWHKSLMRNKPLHVRLAAAASSLTQPWLARPHMFECIHVDLLTHARTHSHAHKGSSSYGGLGVKDIDDLSSADQYFRHFHCSTHSHMQHLQFLAARMNT